jgi:ABC-type spermidine/putrescine transport system permease subunit II
MRLRHLAVYPPCSPVNTPAEQKESLAMTDGLSAWQLILSGDATLFAIVRLSLAVSLSAVVLAALAGMPLGALLALTRFPGRSVLVVLLNALMGLPPVVSISCCRARARWGPWESCSRQRPWWSRRPS